MSDLARHVGEFTGFWTHVLCEGTGRPKTPYTGLSDDLDVRAWYREIADSLVTELRATPPDTTVWTWAPNDQSARFAARRSANELAVHRFDTQSARGSEQPIDATTAADGRLVAVRPDGA